MKKATIKELVSSGSEPDLGLALRRIRQEHKYSQFCVAYSLGISRNTYILYERNKVKLSVIQCLKLCELYNIKLSTFVLQYLEKAIKQPALRSA